MTARLPQPSTLFVPTQCTHLAPCYRISGQRYSAVSEIPLLQSLTIHQLYYKCLSLYPSLNQFTSPQPTVLKSHFSISSHLSPVLNKTKNIHSLEDTDIQMMFFTHLALMSSIPGQCCMTVFQQWPLFPWMHTMFQQWDFGSHCCWKAWQVEIDGAGRCSLFMELGRVPTARDIYGNSVNILTTLNYPW
jgi:hypothetical protein